MPIERTMPSSRLQERSWLLIGMWPSPGHDSGSQAYSHHLGESSNPIVFIWVKAAVQLFSFGDCQPGLIEGLPSSTTAQRSGTADTKPNVPTNLHLQSSSQPRHLANLGVSMVQTSLLICGTQQSPPNLPSCPTAYVTC